MVQIPQPLFIDIFCVHVNYEWKETTVNIRFGRVYEFSRFYLSFSFLAHSLRFIFQITMLAKKKSLSTFSLSKTFKCLLIFWDKTQLLVIQECLYLGEILKQLSDPSKQRGKSEDFCTRNNWFDIGTSLIHLDIEIKLLI